MEELLCCMGMVEMQGMWSCDAIDVIELKKKHLMGISRKPIGSHTDATETT